MWVSHRSQRTGRDGGRHRPCTAASHPKRRLGHTDFSMSSYHHIAGSLVVLASLSGCTEDPAGQAAPEIPTIVSERATVVGHVVDTRGIAVAGATVAVRASGEHAITDSKGAFTVDVPANTTLTLAATAPNMAPTLL